MITFPDIGDAGIIAGLFLKDAGIEFVKPPLLQRAEETAAFRDAPEDMCLPFKLFMVQLEKAWEQGADTVVIPSSHGPCRLGEFCELLRVMLERRGCAYDWIVIDAPRDIGVKEVFRRLSAILPDDVRQRESRRSLFKKINRTRHLLKQLETFECDIRQNAGYYANPDEANELISECRKELLNAENLEEAYAVMGRFRWKKLRLKTDFSRKPVKVALTGEIFTLNEPYANRHIEDRLTSLGVCSSRDITLNRWLRKTATEPLQRFADNVSHEFYRKSGIGYSARKKKIWEHIAGKNYMRYEIGGYTRDGIRLASAAKARGFDGVIQIFPSGCMPEIVGHATLGRIAEETGLPVMSLIYDEMSADAGYITRLEAFTDMLQRKKTAK